MPVPRLWRAGKRSRNASDGSGRPLVADALPEFDGVWETLTPQEQTRMLDLLVERVARDGAAENVSITFRPGGINSLFAANPISSHCIRFASFRLRSRSCCACSGLKWPARWPSVSIHVTSRDHSSADSFTS